MNIAVYGYYYKNNIGDQLFIEAFKELFPKYNFTFVNHLTEPALKNADAWNLLQYCWQGSQERNKPG